MKVHLIKRQSIEDYAALNAGSRLPFALWLTSIKAADWNLPEDIQSTFGAADILGNGSDRVIFNIGSNHFRMICHYVFAKKKVRLYICWIGTHAAYSRLCKRNQQYTVSVY